MKYLYTVKWRAFEDYRKTNADWKTDIRQNYHFVMPGTYIDIPEHYTEIEVIKLEKIQLEFHGEYYTDILKAIEAASNKGLLEEAAELIHAAKELGIEEEPQNMRL